MFGPRAGPVPTTLSLVLVRPPQPAPPRLDDLLGPEFLRRLDRLDVISRKVFAGKLPGERRSKRRGHSVEFDDFRPYTPGDDLRHIDWHVLARLDRLVVKLFRAEEDLGVRVVLDTSPSMRAGDPLKVLTGARLAMAIGYIGLVNNDRVSAVEFGGPRGYRAMTPVRGRRHTQRLGRFLLEALGARAPEAPSRPMPLNEALRRIAIDTRGGSGLVVVISDFLDRSGVKPGLDALAARGQFDVVCVQTLSPGELDPALEAGAGLVGDLRLTDAESGPDAEVTLTGVLIRKYRDRLDRFVADLSGACAARGMTHLLVRSDADIADLIERSLRSRGVLG